VKSKICRTKVDKSGAGEDYESIIRVPFKMIEITD